MATQANRWIQQKFFTNPFVALSGVSVIDDEAELPIKVAQRWRPRCCDARHSWRFSERVSGSGHTDALERVFATSGG